jgi:transcriptional regulator ATRX
MWLRLMDGRTSKTSRGGLGSLCALRDGDKGSGCILAHNMGLGKTFQVVTLLHTIASNVSIQENIEMHRMLVLGPVNTMHNWKAELHRYLPRSGPNIDVWVLDEAGKNNEQRCDALGKWFKHGGVMCMGYEMYRNLVLGVRVKDKHLKERFDRYLRDPGPGIVVADEGHVLRNHKSNISIALSKVTTRRRCVLTGSPLQNNLSEYHCMVDFINPGLLGSLIEFRNRFEIPILNGEAEDAREEDVRIMKQRNYVLNKQLAHMVQRKDFTPLRKSLPPKFEFTLMIRLSEMQRRLYKYALSHREECSITTLFTAYHTLMKVWNHPAVLYLAMREKAAKGDRRWVLCVCVCVCMHVCERRCCAVPGHAREGCKGR